MVRTPATATSAAAVTTAVPAAKDRPVPCAPRFGDVQERSRSTCADRPVAGVRVMRVLFTSSTSFARRVPVITGPWKVEPRSGPCK